MRWFKKREDWRFEMLLNKITNQRNEIHRLEDMRNVNRKDGQYRVIEQMKLEIKHLEKCLERDSEELHYVTMDNDRLRKELMAALVTLKKAGLPLVASVNTPSNEDNETEHQS